MTDYERRRRKRKERRRRKENKCPECGKIQHHKMKKNVFYEKTVERNNIKLEVTLYRNRHGSLVAEARATHQSYEAEYLSRDLWEDDERRGLLFGKKVDPQENLEKRVMDALTELHKKVAKMEDLYDVEIDDEMAEEMIDELFDEEGGTRR